ncbi:MAG: DNA alkylation repair protein [Bacilli bacterium]|nr:DNA alkylation repair protein [Bacilli bacterium]
MKEIVDLLFSKQDIKFRDFQAPLFPTIDKERIIGVRTPDIKQLAKELYGKDTANEFIKELPHYYFDENQLHVFLISRIKDYQECLKEVNKFLPYIDNWATCDTLDPKVFAKHKEELLIEIKCWLKSKHTYIVRFAIGMLLGYYLDDCFKEEYLDWVSSIKSEEYYINMMIAWYFATALAKQYPYAIKYIEEKKLSLWVHNKTIQKAVESYRVSDEQKTYLKSLKIAKN